MQRARRSLLRRDTTTAAKEIQLTDELFAELLGTNLSIASEQQELPELLLALEETLKLLEGFWVQVANSCCRIPGGQEIKVGQQILGFVEADSQQIILETQDPTWSTNMATCHLGWLSYWVIKCS